jgi:hypothetical protein
MLAKKYDDFVKFHLTASREKLISTLVINFYSQNFAPHARFEKGVISHGKSTR